MTTIGSGVQKIRIRDEADAFRVIYVLHCFQKKTSSDRLRAFAEKEFGSLPNGHNRVMAICNWIYDTLDCRLCSSDFPTTAAESLLLWVRDRTEAQTTCYLRVPVGLHCQRNPQIV